MGTVFEVAANISTPLMLAGFLAAAFFFLARQIIKANIFPTLTRQLSGEIIRIIINRFFVLAITAMLLGFVGYVLGMLYPAKAIGEDRKEYYAAPAADLVKLLIADISAINFVPRPDVKNLTLTFKVIPKSDDKYVPVKAKGELIIFTPANASRKYVFDVNVDEEGIKPQVVSSIVLDGLLPLQEYVDLRTCTGCRAIAVIYYDSDIAKTKQKFVADTFLLDKTTIQDLSDPIVK